MGLAMEQPAEECLFGSAHAALVFAFNYSGQCYDRPLMNRLAAPSTGSGKGLAGLDGAAQAGMIRAEVKSLGNISEAMLIARIAPRTMPCSCRSACCSGKKINAEWSEAINCLSQHVSVALSGCLSHYRLRSAIVQKFFGVKVSMVEVADYCAVARTTANDHQAKIVKKLKVEENRAWVAIENSLQSLGIIGEIQNS